MDPPLLPQPSLLISAALALPGLPPGLVPAADKEELALLKLAELLHKSCLPLPALLLGECLVLPQPAAG